MTMQTYKLIDVVQCQRKTWQDKEDPDGNYVMTDHDPLQQMAKLREFDFAADSSF